MAKMKKTFLDLLPKRIPAPFHRHNFLSINKTKLFPIVDNRQFYKIKAKCSICGEIIEYESWDKIKKGEQ